MLFQFGECFEPLQMRAPHRVEHFADGAESLDIGLVIAELAVSAHADGPGIA